MKQPAKCSECGFIGPLPIEGPGGKCWCPARRCQGEMVLLPEGWEPAVDLSRPVDANPAPTLLTVQVDKAIEVQRLVPDAGKEAIAVQSAALPDGTPHVIARRLIEGKVELDPQRAFNRICDLILVEAQAIEFLGFADAADLLRRAVQKIRSDGV